MERKQTELAGTVSTPYPVSLCTKKGAITSQRKNSQQTSGAGIELISSAGVSQLSKELFSKISPGLQTRNCNFIPYSAVYSLSTSNTTKDVLEATCELSP